MSALEATVQIVDPNPLKCGAAFARTDWIQFYDDDEQEEPTDTTGMTAVLTFREGRCGDELLVLETTDSPPKISLSVDGKVSIALTAADTRLFPGDSIIVAELDIVDGTTEYSPAEIELTTLAEIS